MNARYLALECKLILRSGRFLIFTLGMPVVVFLIQAAAFGGKDATYPDGTPVTPSVMVSMATFGAMAAALSTGSRIAVERAFGWQRQLRLTPMSGTTYLLTKGLLGMLVAVPSVLLVSLTGGVVEGVRLDAAQWLQVTAGVWLGVIPFAVLGILIGQFATADSLQAVNSAVMLVLGFAGGLWIPSQVVPDWMQHVMKATPTYWLREIGQSAFTGGAQVGTAMLVLAGYAVVAGVIVARRYAADTVRV
jgi:ABC-2 type transport system permease protein